VTVGAQMINDWIPVNAKLPASSGAVLVYTKSQIVQAMFRKGHRTLSYFAKEDGSHLADVTHWRPLLLPPEPDRP
jgi:hypothetical protein